jgi:hypothetical protein
LLVVGLNVVLYVASVAEVCATQAMSDLESASCSSSSESDSDRAAERTKPTTTTTPTTTKPAEDGKRKRFEPGH